MHELLRITPRDNVAVALRALTAGEVLQADDVTVTVKTDVPAGHKIALTDLKENDHVIKYGYPIGYAKADIPAGSHVHVHNLHTLLSGELTYTYRPTHPALEPLPERTFMGYPRKDGRVGIRNELIILPTVGCVNDVARGLERDAQRLAGGGVEKVYAFAHPYGCSQMTEDQENTRRVLADLATHPNFGGVLLLGLGCENSGVDIIRSYMGDFDPDRVRFLICQQVEDEHEAGMKLLEELAENMRGETRVPCPASKLVVGLKCGGSDGFSGITANPLLGAVSDGICAAGGTALLTEVPEMFGAEELLMARCKDEEVFKKTCDLVNGFKKYYQDHHMPVYENPSPGNKAGGITTLEEKSLGCTQKGGLGEVQDVLQYTMPVEKKGLNLVWGPGNDICAVTSLSAAGAQMILFTTGRGTPLGGPAPTLKVATNANLAAKKHGWIDFNAGQLLQGVTMEEAAQQLFQLVLATANGQETQAEKHGYREIAIFKDGVTL